MKRSLSLFAAGLALSLAATAPSQANPFSYTYNWNATTIGPAAPSALSTVAFGGPTALNPTGAGTGGVSFTNEDPVQSNIETDTAATNITVFSSADASNPDVVTPSTGSNYSVAVTLSDANPADTPKTITFSGLLTGQLTAQSSNLTNVITGSTDSTGTHAGQQFGQVQVGNELFTVSYAGFAPPGPEAQHNKGAVSFHIAFAPVIDGGGSAPEPSSVVLGCLGLSCLGGVVFRSRRRKAAMLKVAV